jgi:NAD(P)-dependent dehydrogenase (short-subunit alcohol dehydrogenase family)
MSSKLAVVTGASRGVGYAVAESLLKQGWIVIGLSRSPCHLDIEYPKFVPIQCNITEKTDVKRAFMKLENAKIDLLVNCASIFNMQPFGVSADTHSIINTNVIGTIDVTGEALSLMNTNSRIIFINSVAGLEELENQALYCASKWAITGFAGVLGKELRSKKIKVTSIHPGGINTSLWNEGNPYPVGDVTKALQTSDIVDAINYILSCPDYVEVKTLKLFPDIEWH